MRFREKRNTTEQIITIIIKQLTEMMARRDGETCMTALLSGVRRVHVCSRRQHRASCRRASAIVRRGGSPERAREFGSRNVSQWVTRAPSGAPASKELTWWIDFALKLTFSRGTFLVRKKKTESKNLDSERGRGRTAYFCRDALFFRFFFPVIGFFRVVEQLLSLRSCYFHTPFSPRKQR